MTEARRSRITSWIHRDTVNELMSTPTRKGRFDQLSQSPMGMVLRECRARWGAVKRKAPDLCLRVYCEAISNFLQSCFK